MFGAGNEPLTIEEFYSRIPVGVDLNAYNDGEVIPFTAEGIKSIGDNACDEEWELGTLNLGTGGTGESSSQLRSKNFCKLIGGEEYNLHSTTNTNAGQILLYDKDYKFLDYFSFYGKDRLLEVPQQAQFFKVLLQPTYGITYNHDICVSLVHSGYKEGKYYPYEQDIRKIDQRIKDAFPNGMMPWDKVYNKNGKGYIVKGTGVVECGSLVNKMNAKVGEFSLSTPANYNAIDSTYNIPSLLISPYVAATGYDADSKGLDMCIYGMNDWMIIRDSRYTDVASFKSEMADVPLYYELAKPTIIEYDEPFNLDYLVWDFGTEEIIAEGASAPLKADIIYQFNAVDEIRELRQLIATMQAQMAQMVATTIE